MAEFSGTTKHHKYPMASKLDKITEKYLELPYMRHEQAVYIRDIILKNKFFKLCELGHLHGKSSIYLASVLEEQGFGHLWTFDLIFTQVKPSIHDLLEEFNLTQYVTPIVTHEGYVWDLVNFKNNGSQTFDFCYIDGGHSFESTALAFILIDKLLDTNGIIIFDDYNWTVESSINAYGTSILNIPMYKNMSEQQRLTPQVKMVCDFFLTDSNYELLDRKMNWAVYRKLDHDK